MRHIPNALCILRMLLVVPVAWLLVTDNYRLTLAMFAFAAATDGLDGFLAKRFGWTSELGKILDPLADKILLVGVFITLAAIGVVPVWLAATAVLRDVTITAGAIIYKGLFGYGELHGRPTAISRNRLRASEFPRSLASWHFLYFLPLPHGQTSLRPVLAIVLSRQTAPDRNVS
jgi:cardiolipin synthase